MEFRRAVTANLNLKIGREKLIVNRDVQMEVLTESGQLEEDGFFEARAIDIPPTTSIAIVQVTWQESTCRINLDWMSHIVLWNCG